MSLTLLTALTAFAFAQPAGAVAGDAPERPSASDFQFTPSTTEVISLSLLDGEPADSPASNGASLSSFGDAGTKRLYFQGAGAVHVKDSEDIFGQIGVGLEYFIADDLSLDVELNGLYVDQEGENAVGANLALLFRWHFISRDDWSMYFDGGAGLLGTTNDVPFNGSSFNFTPQAGLGFTFDLGDSNRLMVGMRWHHISNAHTYEHNPGRDSVMAYVGLSIPF